MKYNNGNQHKRNRQRWLIVYLIISLAFFLGVALSFWDYSYYGYFSDKIIGWAWLVFTPLVIIGYWKNKAVRWYAYGLLLFVLLSILPMAIPFFNMLNYFSTTGDYQRFRLNRDYRLERTRQQPLSIERLYIYKRIGLLEKNICRTPYSCIVGRALKITGNSGKQEALSLPIRQATFTGASGDSIGIRYYIAGKSTIFFHKIRKDGY